jgi:DNA-binding transcriptional LysR family regulator
VPIGGWAKSSLAAGLQPSRIVEVPAYHALLASIAAGSGFGFAPRSMLETVRHLEEVSVHSPGALGRVETLLVWRTGNYSGALDALKATIAAQGGCATQRTGCLNAAAPDRPPRAGLPAILLITNGFRPSP